MNGGLIRQSLPSKSYIIAKVRNFKTIGNLLDMSPHELFHEITARNIECPITLDVDEYTQSVTDEIINRLQFEKN